MSINLPIQPDSFGNPSITYRNSALEGFVRNNGQWSICLTGPSPIEETYVGESLVHFKRYCENNLKEIVEGCNVYGLENVLVAAYESGVSDGSNSLLKKISREYPNISFPVSLQESVLDDYVDAAYAASTPVKIINQRKQDPRLTADEAYKRYRLGMK